MHTVLQAGFVMVLFTCLALAGGPGFRTKHLLEEHYARYRGHFGGVTQEQYLHMAQQLRDSRPSKNTLEARREDGSGSKFDLKRGWFVAFDADGTLRTFFVPRHGLRYFKRQANLQKVPE